MRSDRDSSSVLIDEEIREREALSGAMLKLASVWAMSWQKYQLRDLKARNKETHRGRVFVKEHGCGSLYFGWFKGEKQRCHGGSAELIEV